MATRTPRTPPSRRSGPRSAPRKPAQQNEVLEWVKQIAVALVLFLVIRTFLVQAFSIPSGSMEPTLRIGDYLMANNAVFGAHVPFTDIRLPSFQEPEHGDIVVFRPTYNNPVIDVVKRVIGEPGDTVAMRGGVMYRNGERLVEPYVQRSGTADEPLTVQNPYARQWHLGALTSDVNRASYQPTRDNWGPLVVPPGHFFLMGDNRDASLDSRYMGFIPRDVIRGAPMFVYFSYDPAADAPFPRFLSAARWGRIGTVLH